MNSPLPSRALESGGEQPAADHERRIEPAFGEHARDQARGRRLAVRAGDRDALLQAHQLGQHQRARHDRDAALARARRTSGLSAATAVETTTASAPCDVAPRRGRCAMRAPSCARRARHRALGEVGAAHL